MHNNIMRKFITSFLIAGGFAVSGCHVKEPNISADWINQNAYSMTNDDDVCFTSNYLTTLNHHRNAMKKTRHDTNPHNYNVAVGSFIPWFMGLSAEDYERLPLSFEATLFETISENRLNFDNDIAYKFYSGVNLSPEIALWWLERNDAYINAVSTDKQLKELSKSWNEKTITITGVGKENTHLSKAHKQYVVRLIEIRAEAFGLNKMPTHSFYNDPAVKEKTGIINGSHKNGHIKINVGQPDHKINDPHKLTNLIAHEMDHFVQNIFKELEVETSANSQNIEHAYLASIFQLNGTKFYYKNATSKTYRSNPIETVAWATAKQIELSFNNPTSYQKQYQENKEAFLTAIAESNSYRKKVKKSGGINCPIPT